MKELFIGIAIGLILALAATSEALSQAVTDWALR